MFRLSCALSVAASLCDCYVEQWVNALVYELIFPDELHTAGLYFFRVAEEVELRPASQRDAFSIREFLGNLYETRPALRQGLYRLDSLETIRIIEGKE